MSAWDYFKAGCELCAGFAQSFWDSLNVWEQIVAVVAGVIGASLVLGCTGGFIAGLIGRRIRARRERKPAATLIEQHEGFDAWHQALCSWTRQKFSVEEAYAMWRKKLYEHPDLTLLYAGQPVAEMSEEE